MVWGAAAAFLANVLYAAGFALEKQALGRLPQVRGSEPLRMLRQLLGSRRWLTGCALLGFGFIAQLVTYRALPITAAQGLLTAGLVLLLLLSSALLGERPSGRERVGAALICAALLMVVVSLHGTPGQLGRTAHPAALLGVSLPTLAVAVCLYTAAERRSRRRHRLPTTGVAYGAAVGLVYGVSSLAMKGASGLLRPREATASAQALLVSPYPLLLLFTAAAGLVLSQTALQRHRASIIVPVSTVVTCVFAIVTGTWAFGEPLPQDPLRLGLRLGGTALAVLVLLVFPRHKPQPAIRTALRTPTLPEESDDEVRRPAAHDPRLSDRQGTTPIARLRGRAVQPPAQAPLSDRRRHTAAASHLG